MKVDDIDVMHNSLKRNTKIKTDYGNKYSVDVQLSSTLIKHKNGERIYSTN